MAGQWVDNTRETALREEVVIEMDMLAQSTLYDFEVSDRADFDAALGRVTAAQFTTASTISRELDFVIVNGAALSGWAYPTEDTFATTVTFSAFSGDVTVTAGAVDTAATVTVTPASTVDAENGDTITVTITVTVSGGTRTYTLTITVSAFSQGDFNIDVADIADISSDGVHMFVMTRSSTMRAYDLQGAARDSDQELTAVNSLAGFTSNYGVAVTANNVYVQRAGTSSAEVRAFSRPTNTQISVFNAIGVGHTSGAGMAIHNSNLYILDRGADDITVYSTAGVRQTSLEFSLHSDNGDPRGIWVSADRVYVLDRDDKFFVYDHSGSRQTGEEFDLTSTNGEPFGAWSDGQIMWVGDRTDRKLYAYELAGGTYLGTT